MIRFNACLKGIWVAEIHRLGLVTQDDSLTGAIAMAQEALTLVVEDTRPDHPLTKAAYRASSEAPGFHSLVEIGAPEPDVVSDPSEAAVLFSVRAIRGSSCSVRQLVRIFG